jgi:hypothetical protein
MVDRTGVLNDIGLGVYGVALRTRELSDSFAAVRVARLALLTSLLATVASVLPVTVGPDVAEAAPTERRDDTARPLGAVTVLGDSVMLGGIIYAPTIVDELAAQGWGPIRARAGEGYQTGKFATNTTWRSTYWISTWRAQGWDAPNVLVNLGANDSGICKTDVDCAYEAIVHLADAIGPGRNIWWPKITRFAYYRGEQDAWNAALDRVAAERDDFHTWDWPAVMASGPFPSSDNTHLGPDGYRLRSRLMAQAFTADLARAVRVGGDAPLPDPIGDPTRYVPLTPTRVVDTRQDSPGMLAARQTLTVDMGPLVPDGATAVAVNLTSAGTTTGGFLSAHPCDRPRRAVSSVNHAAGVPRGAMAIVPLSADGELCVHTESAGHVVVDLQGAFVPDRGTRLTPVDGVRLVDTRETGRETGRDDPIVIDIADPTVEAIAVNLTATRSGATGYLTADACAGGQSEVSNVNFLPGEPVAGAAIVPVSAAGTICVWSSVPVDVIVDLTGEFRTGDGLRFQPADPRRMLDPRDGTGGWTPVMGADQLVDTRVAPLGAQAVTGTITLVRPVRTGFAVADCRDEPPISTVNARAGEAMANSLTVAIESGGDLCFRSSETATMLFDTTGWWIP